jgi:aryl-alcohol dehydrogenase-like predicted oxidoreductase
MFDRPTRRDVLLAGVAAQAPKAPDAPLPMRVLGRTGLKVTVLGHGSEGVSDPVVLRRSLDMGVNFFDTARNYQGGNNELVLGEVLRGRRKQVVLSSRSYASTAGGLKSDLDASLRSLGTDYLDLWYIGEKNAPEEVTDDMLRVQLDAQKAGKIRFRALSTHRLGRMAAFIAGKGNFDSVQFPYSFAAGTARDPLKVDGTRIDESLEVLQRANVGVVAMKVMAGGYGGRRAGDPLYGLFQRRGAHGAALRWALRNGRVHTTSVRMLDEDQLVENFQAARGAYGRDDERILAAYLDREGERVCRWCGGCDGACPNGVKSADMVRAVMYADGYGEPALGRRCFDASGGRVCASCGECVVLCPQGVDIAAAARRAGEVFALS